jgi:hypothetical protein
MSRRAKNILIDSSLPTNSADTDFIFNTSENIIYYRDRSNRQWVPASSSQAGPQGPIGPQGPAGQDGQDGTDGESLKIKGHKTSASQLPATGNIYNDAWITDDTGFLHIWQGSSWFNIGKIVGLDGAVGPQGPVGPQGASSDATILVETHAALASGVHGVVGSVVGTGNIQTLTGKTIDGVTNTITNVPISNVTGLSTILQQYSPALLTINQKTASYVLVLSDSLSMIETSVATANTITVPLESGVNFPIGTQIVILQAGVGQTTIVPEVGVTINATPGLKLRTRWASATLIKRASDTWVATGDLVA